jgi:anti-sigma factor RsiW
MVEHSVPEIEELIGAYALDAVDDDEREAVEQHLTVCPRCRAELAEHREVAALLAYDGAPAPSDVWDRIVISLEEPPPAMRLRLDSPGHVVSLDDRRIKKQRRIYAAIAGVAAAIILVLGLVVVRQQDNSPNQQLTLERLVDEALATPGATLATLRPPEGVSGPTATAVVTPDGRGYLRADDLPELAADRTYQLWGVVDDQAISLGVLGTSPDIAAFQVDDANRVAAYAITDEAAGGVIASQNDPVVVGETA